MSRYVIDREDRVHRMNGPVLAPGPNGDQYVARAKGRRAFIHAPRWYDAREVAIAHFGVERHEVEITLHEGKLDRRSTCLRVWFRGGNGRFVRVVEKETF